MAEQKCTGEHTQHICALAEANQIEVIKRLTTNPQYICGNCGRAADSDENLCNPVHVNEIGLAEM